METEQGFEFVLVKEEEEDEKPVMLQINMDYSDMEENLVDPLYVKEEVEDEQDAVEETMVDQYSVKEEVSADDEIVVEDSIFKEEVSLNLPTDEESEMDCLVFEETVPGSKEEGEHAEKMEERAPYSKTAGLKEEITSISYRVRGTSSDTHTHHSEDVQQNVRYKTVNFLPRKICGGAFPTHEHLTQHLAFRKGEENEGLEDECLCKNTGSGQSGICQDRRVQPQLYTLKEVPVKKVIMTKLLSHPENVQGDNLRGKGGSKYSKSGNTISNTSNNNHKPDPKPCNTVARSFKCVVCSRRFFKVTLLATHKCINTKCNKCKICGKRFSNSPYIRAHKCVHTEQHKCETCKTTFSDIENLKAHQCRDTWKYKCDICNCRFSSSSYLQVHKQMHTQEYKCEICHSCFCSSVSLEIHKKLHAKDKLNECEICGKTFGLISSLVSHKRAHTDEFKCQTCGRCFSNGGLLVVHRLSKHGAGSLLQCKICGKRFVTSARLLAHNRKHTQEYKCEFCGKCFSYSNILANHNHFNCKEPV